MLLLDLPDVVRIRATRRVPDIAQLERPPDCRCRAAADPDLRQRRRVRLRRRVVEGPVLALEVALAAPECAHHADRLVRAPAAALERHAHEVVLVFVPAHADAEAEAT